MTEVLTMVSRPRLGRRSGVFAVSVLVAFVGSAAQAQPSPEPWVDAGAASVGAAAPDVAAADAGVAEPVADAAAVAPAYAPNVEADAALSASGSDAGEGLASESDAGDPLVADPVAQDDEQRALGTITVTARYRKEDAQNVPIAITTVSGDQLRQLGGTRSLQQIVGQLPSLNVQGFSGRNQTITIRGLGTNAGGTNDGLEQGVGLYIDGVYRPRTGSVITDLMEIESIQLLKGPQGTLFGKNTVAGAVDIRTVEPGFERNAKAEFTYGNYNYLRGYFSVTEPLTKQLTFRLSYLHTARDGLFYNTVFKEKWDNLDNDAVRFDVVYKPTDYIKSRFIADYSMQKCDCGFQTVRRALPTTLADGRPVRGFYDKAAAVGYNPIKIDPFARKIDLNSSQNDRMPSWGLQNKTDLRLDNNLTLSSISAFRKWEWIPNYDGDQTGANVSPLGIVQTYQRQVSQEFRLASPGDQVIDYSAGLYFFWQQANDYQFTSYGTQASQWLISPSTPAAVLNNLVAFSHVVPATASYAGYGQATWNVNDSFHLTGGVRLTYEHKTGSYKAYAAGDVAPIDSLPLASQAAAVASRASFGPEGQYDKSLNTKNASGTAIASYDVTRDVHTFLTYSRGYKSPGINLVRQSLGVNVFVKPEKVDDFEFGIKSAYFDGRLELNPTAFYTIDRGYQSNYYNTTVMPAAQYITNVGTLVSRGVELDARLYPTAGFSATGSLTYNDARYQSYKNAPAQYLQSYLGTQDLSGKQASGAPRFAAGSTVEYRHKVGALESGPVEGFLGANWSYRSHFRAAVNLDPFSNIPGYHLLGLNAGVRTASKLELSFWMRNVTNHNYFNTASVNATYNISQATLGEPRTFGATLRGEI
ncbi:MAG: TonB-dependent receptor [Myxococcaceae bacterium]|nr:TonB-dependent receptor [Myxococcaceae bacterium]